jgi:diguanylate cyclase (GGDEF)-like protein/PAS domain S-box-containing protein
MLLVLSDVFSADVTMLAHAAPPRMVVRHSCGLAEDDPAHSQGWALPAASVSTLGRAGLAALGGTDAEAMPAPLAALGARFAVWIPLDVDAELGDVLVLCRRGGEEFTQLDLQVLASVTHRLRMALQEREQSAVMARLAQSGHLLARHLDLVPLLDEAAALLRALTGADDAWVVTVRDGRAVRQAHSGVDDTLEPGDWLPGWEELCRGAPYLLVDGDRRLICVPVMRDGEPCALLYVARSLPRPLTGDAVEILAVFANYVAAAITNAELYRALGQSESSLRLITDSISDLVAMVGPDGRFAYASPSHGRELAREPERLVGRLVTDFVHPDDRERLEGALEGAASGDKVEYRLRTGSGHWTWVESALRPAPSAGGTVVLSSRVIDDRKRLEDELRLRATHDPLTGLANRTLVAQRLSEALADHDGEGHVGLLFCDLDRFKAVNDRLGHEAGDDLLKQVAARLRHSLRPGDLLGRFGGDEFVVVLDGVGDLADVAQVGRRVARALDDTFRLYDEPVRISASVGGVLGVRRRTTASAMLRDADAAMYAAKDRGLGLIEVFDDAASSRSLDRLGLRSDLLGALEGDQFAVHYQPIYELTSRRVVAFEALLRWTHPRRGPVPPDVFIPLAEETGAIVPIGHWVLEQSCRELARWGAGGQRVRVNVNLSPVQLQQPHLARELLDIVHESGVDPGDVCLEVTEHSYLREDVTEGAAVLRSAGLHFALDDFGTSYSSLNYLKWFPIDLLKVDRSFVGGVAGSDTDRGIVRAVLAIADSLRLGVIAEGVETEEQLSALVDLGCVLGQGHLLSPPLTPDAAAALLAADRHSVAAS